MLLLFIPGQSIGAEPIKPVWGSGWRDQRIIQIPAETWSDHRILCVAEKKRIIQLQDAYPVKIRRYIPPCRAGQCRRFRSPARSQSLHTVAPSENVTFPLQAHLAGFFILL